MRNLAIVYIKKYSKRLGQEKFLINELKTIATEIYIVCNGVQDGEILWEIDEDHFLKGEFKNRIEAYRSAYRYFEMHDMKFDDLILCDNSFFGPFVSLLKILEVMNKKDVDCWMISKYAKMFARDYKVIPAHVDSSFLYFTKKIVSKKLFIDFWSKNITQDEIVEEINLNHYLDEAGVKWTTYIEYSSLDSERTINNIEWLERLPYSMLNEYESPILKKSCFVKNDYRYTNTNEVLKACEYIKERTKFDENIIWDYLLENFDIADIIDMLHLNYVLSGERNLLPTYQNKKCAIIMHITYLNAIEESVNYIKNLPEEIDLYITTKGNECISRINSNIERVGRKNYKVLLAGERGRDVSALLVTCKDILMKYEYLCFVHDNKTRNNLGPLIIGESSMWVRWSNSIKNAEYISNVLELFEKNERLGILVPPIVYAGGSFSAIARSWATSYNATVCLAKRLGLSVNISEKRYNYSIGTTFWCRTNAMRKLFEAGLTYDDFPAEPLPTDGIISHAVERILLYVAQDAGYYAAVVENNEYASGHISDFNYMLRQILNKSMMPISGYFDVYLSNFELANLEDFVKKNVNVYIYGNGSVARDIKGLLEKWNLKYKACVISDDQEKKEKDVIYVSEIPEAKESIGIIVALTGYYQREVVPALLEKGYTNLYIV